MDENAGDIEAAYPGDQLSQMIANTLVDRGMSIQDAIAAVDAAGDQWDAFARQFVDPLDTSEYKGER